MQSNQKVIHKLTTTKKGITDQKETKNNHKNMQKDHKEMQNDNKETTQLQRETKKQTNTQNHKEIQKWHTLSWALYAHIKQGSGAHGLAIFIFDY